MSFVVLERRTFFNNSQVDSVDARHFHGRAMRGGVFPDSKSARLQFDVDIPLKIRKNVFGGMPAVFCPEGELVVREDIAAELNRCFNISYSMVEFSILYDFDYKSEGVERYDVQMRQIDLQRHQPGIQVAPYCMIDCPPIWLVNSTIADAPLIKVSVTQGGHSESREYPASEDVFREFPIYSTSSFVMKSSIFEVIRPHLDLRFFAFSEKFEYRN